MQTSIFQIYKDAEKSPVDFSEITLKKIENQKIVKNIAIQIFEKFNCSNFSENESIEKFNEIFELKNSKFKLLNFNPKSPIFSFLNFLKFNNISSEVIFTLNEFSKLEKLEISYSIMQLEDLSKPFKYKVFLNFDRDLNINNIIYERFIKEKVDISKTSILKTSDMLCSEEEESFLIELFLFGEKNDFFNMLQECYFVGNNVPTIDYELIKSKHSILSMIYI